MVKKKTILVAPLNWGLGHATRCIPIIKSLISQKYNVIIASDGISLKFLKKEFPLIKAIELPSYNISYSRYPFLFKLHIILQLPHIKKTIFKEKKIILKLIENKKIDGIISDNRFGVWNKNIPTVYISHQIQVLSGFTTFFSSKIHQKVISKFSICWVPDIEKALGFSGKLGHLKKPLNNTKYIGWLTRLKQLNLPKKYDVLIILSGPEPQRGLLEKKILSVFKNASKKIMLVQGIVEETTKITSKNNIDICNFMNLQELEKTIHSSEWIISRSGYTSIMDLICLQKKVLFIPTPGQDEQEYLAKHLKKMGIAPYCKQKDFSEAILTKMYGFKYPKIQCITPNYEELFTLFERK